MTRNGIRGALHGQCVFLTCHDAEKLFRKNVLELGVDFYEQCSTKAKVAVAKAVPFIAK